MFEQFATLQGTYTHQRLIVGTTADIASMGRMGTGGPSRAGPDTSPAFTVQGG